MHMWKGLATPSVVSSLLSFRDEENFCATVPKDGRSYSPTLFAQTVRVLKKINKPGNMIVAFSNLAERIKVRGGGGELALASSLLSTKEPSFLESCLLVPHPLLLAF